MSIKKKLWEDVCCSYDSRMGVSCSNNKTLELFDITQEKLIKTFRGHQNYVFCCNFNPRSTLLVSGSFDGTHLCPFIACHSDPISAVGFNRDGSLIATRSYDDLVRIWEAGSGQYITTLVGLFF
uniref:Uncharacterized protein n=1 Tax=Meloidogyne enterolobii TaxID=390850 RepID=A0A6V7XNJ2_MELEN|nr:unnamed protein product [Meloidogyne enterolobii]